MTTRSPICGSISRWRRSAAALLALLLPAALAAQPAHEDCVNVQVGTAQSYGCINAALARAAAQARAPLNAGTLSAASPPNQLGLFDRAATAERLGNAFGHSVIAQRPAR